MWFKSKQKPKPKPKAIMDLEKRIGKTIKEIPFWEIKYGTNGYALNERGEVTGMHLNEFHISDLSFLKVFPCLTHLHLGSNQIEDISSLAHLNALIELNLERNYLTDISPLSELTALKTLDLNFTQITDISPLARLTDLIELNLASNQITDLSPLAGLTSLKKLVLYNNKITDISPLARLTALTNLDLSLNQLTDISPLAPLTALIILNLNSNQITDLSPLTRLTALIILNLNSNQIADISPLARLTALIILNLDSNQITDISPLAPLTALDKLSLGGNQITDISPLARLKQLNRLDLINNNIRQLPEALLDTRLEIKWDYDERGGLFLADNPLETPPIEVVKQGKWAVRNFFKELKDKESVRLLQCKLLIVGNGEVGKTTLMKKLIDNAFDIQSIQEKSTHGINIQPWPLAVPFNDPDPGKTEARETVNLVFWDFGGQDIYHATHQFFLTKRSLYLFVWEPRREEETRSFDYWLNVIKLLSQDSRVIVVMNKGDLRTKHIDEAGFKAKFPNIQAFYKISCLTGQGIRELTEEIRSNLSQMDHLRDQLPRVWVQIRDRLKKEKEKNNKNYIPQEEYFSICAEYGLNEERALFLSGYLHDLGVILHYQNDPLLQHTVILNPEWATEAVYKLIDTREIIENRGSFYFNDLKRHWDAKKYPHAKHPELVRLMEKFELCFNFTGTDLHFVPELQKSPAGDLDFTHYNSPGTLRFEYHYDFMPEGIVSRFMARMFYLILEKKRFWKNRVELKFEDSTALVAGEPLNRRVTIAITGKYQRDLLSIIRSHFDAIHSTLNMEKNRHYHEMIPCTCPKCLESQTPNFYRYEKLKEALETNVIKVQCFESFKEVSVEEMLDRVSPRQPKPGLTESLITSLSQLQGISSTIRPDEDSRNGFIALLLSKDGHIVKDQTRWGRSASGKSAGEIDIKIEGRDGRTTGIIEAFSLDCLDKNVIDRHLNKIFNYDAGGLSTNFILVYAEA